MSERMDSFVFEAQRVLGNQGDRLSRIEASVETLAATAQCHDRNAEADSGMVRLSGVGDCSAEFNHTRTRPDRLNSARSKSL